MREYACPSHLSTITEFKLQHGRNMARSGLTNAKEKPSPTTGVASKQKAGCRRRLQSECAAAACSLNAHYSVISDL
jgi:hypothetical protein